MIIKVHPHELELIENEKTNEKESYVSDFTFEFDDEITDDFTKEAYFTKEDKTYKVIIQDDRCDYAPEVIQEIGYVDIGVSAFKVDGDKTIRYNPTPITKYIDEGSMKDAENSVPITPSEMEQFEQQLNEGLEELEEAIASIDVDTHYAREMGDYAKQQGDYSKEQGDSAKELIDNFDGTIQEIKASIPKKISDLPNDAGYVTKSVNDLTNYYTKDDTYTKSEIDGKVSAVYKYKGSIQNYSDLPVTGMEVGDVYNIVNADSEYGIKAGDNVVWSGSNWDNQGGNVDLSEYYTKTQTDTLLNNKVNNSELNNYYNKTRTDELLNGKVNNSTYETKMTQIDSSLANKLEQSDLTDYVKNTDYASSSKGGVVKLSNTYATTISEYGTLNCLNKTYSDYGSLSNGAFISKGTLENVITGKDLVNKTYVDDLVGDIETILTTLDVGSGV